MKNIKQTLKKLAGFGISASVIAILGFAQNAKADVIPCSQIFSSIIALQNQESSFSNNVNEYMGEITITLQGWYASLSPHEGTTSFIPYGQFSSIQTTATSVQQSQSIYQVLTSQNSVLLGSIIESLPGCLSGAAGN